MTETLARAGGWFLTSGIQEPNGGVARFYRADLGCNRAISTEITGYTASALAYLHSVTGDDAYLDRARRTAHFLARDAWDAEADNFPFEYGEGAESMLYFFDCGIIVRGLLAVWRERREQGLLDRVLLERAVDCGRAMIRDFDTRTGIHPILTLPDKTPIARDWRWSRNPGCYQLKSALAWRELAEITGESDFDRAFSRHLERSLADYSDFLPGDSQPERVMDRLHAFSYFLESLVFYMEDERCVFALADGIAQVGRHLREIAPVFARADVYAQLLRVRLWASGTLPLDRDAAQEEAEALMRFQVRSDDPRVDGGFAFGARQGEMIPHINPVSTAFALQALHMWHTRRAAPAGDIDLSRPVYLAFATGPQRAMAEFLDRVAESNPDSALLVVSRQQPSQFASRGEWIEIPAGQGTGAIIAACRRAIAGRPIRGAAIHATKRDRGRGAEWRMRIAALAIAGRDLRIYNDNLDHFRFGDTSVLWRHLKWRWSQRPRGVLWWKLLAGWAISCRVGVGLTGRRPAPRTGAATQPGISLVIPTRDGRDLLAAMLPQVIADLQTHTAEIIVVDNGSSDNTAAFLAEHDPRIRIESSRPPLSFAEAVNRGIDVAQYSHDGPAE